MVAGRPPRTVIAAALLAVTTTARAAPPGRGPRVAALAAPTHTDGPGLQRAAAAAAERLAARLGGAVVAPGDALSIDLPAVLARARTLAESSQLDDAAASYDLALAAGAGAPHLVPDPAAFVDAHVTRASIALARDEAEVAAALLERLLRYEPGFAPRPADDRPRLRDALAAARARLGETPDLRPEELGSACRGAADVVLVARRAAGGVEYLRFDGCRLVARVTTRTLGREAIDLLAGEAARAVASPAPAARRDEARGFPWLWVGLGAAAVAGATGAIFWYVSRDDDEVTFTPHL